MDASLRATAYGVPGVHPGAARDEKFARAAASRARRAAARGMDRQRTRAVHQRDLYVSHHLCKIHVRPRQ